MTEYRFDSKADAESHRLEFLAQGGSVTPVAFDMDRDAFVIDVRGPVSFWQVALAPYEITHKGHFSQFGLWYCDTCQSAYCELA